MGFTLGRIFGVPIRLHWSALLGAWVFTGFHFDLVAWACFLGIVIAHELGHALIVKAAGGRATLIELTGYGGLCHWRGDVSAIGRACIAWGGVWAQLLLLGAAVAWQAANPHPGSFVEWRILAALTGSNVWMIAINLVPLPPLDGAEAWRLPILLGRSLRKTPAGSVMLTPPATTADEAFEAGERRDEVRAVVSSILDEARKP